MSRTKKRPSLVTGEAEPLANALEFVRRWPWLVEGLLFSLLALVLTWPLARNLSSAIPFGGEPAATVPLASLWALWWNSDVILHLYQGYWDAPIFHGLSSNSPLDTTAGRRKAGAIIFCTSPSGARIAAPTGLRNFARQPRS